MQVGYATPVLCSCNNSRSCWQRCRLRASSSRCLLCLTHATTRSVAMCRVPQRLCWWVGAAVCVAAAGRRTTAAGSASVHTGSSTSLSAGRWQQLVLLLPAVLPQQQQRHGQEQQQRLLNVELCFKQVEVLANGAASSCHIGSPNLSDCRLCGVVCQLPSLVTNTSATFVCMLLCNGRSIGPGRGCQGPSQSNKGGLAAVLA
jgi:hypothetical protein